MHPDQQLHPLTTDLASLSDRDLATTVLSSLTSPPTADADSFVLHAPLELMARADATFRAVLDGSLRVRVGRTFPLAEARAAHQALESRQTTGKILLIP